MLQKLENGIHRRVLYGLFNKSAVPIDQLDEQDQWLFTDVFRTYETYEEALAKAKEFNELRQEVRDGRGTLECDKYGTCDLYVKKCVILTYPWMDIAEDKL